MLGITDVGLWVAYAMILLFGAVLGSIALMLLSRGTGLRT
jgi:ABC-2 type transport system permease protein